MMRRTTTAAALALSAGACGGDGGTTIDDPASPTWGELTVTVATTGDVSDLDLDGYDHAAAWNWR